MILSPNEVAWLVGRYWPLGPMTVAGKPKTITVADQIDLIATAYEESAFNTDVISFSPATRADGTPNPNYGQADHGLWQISSRWNHVLLKDGGWRDPHQNTAMALSIYKTQGLVAWHAASDGWHPKTRAIAEMAHPRPIALPLTATVAMR